MLKKVLIVIVSIAFYPIAIPILVYRRFVLKKAIKEINTFITQENTKLGDKEAYEKLILIIKRAKNGSKHARRMCFKIYALKINKKSKNTLPLFDDNWEFLKKNYHLNILLDSDVDGSKESLFEYIAPDLPTQFSSDGNFSWIAVPNATPEAILECLEWNQMGSCNWQGLHNLIGWKNLPFDVIRNGNETFHRSAAKKLKRYQNGIFISPTVNNWCLLIDFNDFLIGHEELRSHMLSKLSNRFHSSFFFNQFNNHDAIGCYQRFDNGNQTRSANWSDEDTPPKAMTEGPLTAEENAMGIHQIDSETASISVPEGKSNEYLERRWIIDDMSDVWGCIHPDRLHQRTDLQPDTGMIMLVKMSFFTPQDKQPCD